MASITLKNITKTYDGASSPVVPDLNLEIRDKEFIILVGPSGCGKSTTLRMIAGLESITSGELYIGDRLVNKIPPKDRDIAMVFQNYALYPHMSVYKNIAFGLTLRKVPKEEIDRRVHEAAKVLDLEPYLDRKPKAMSGGQRQRVALGRAMVRDPSVFLLDEPLSNLDAKLRASMRAELIRLHQRLDTTFVYVTHDQTEAMTMGDRIVVMKDGIVQQFDTPQMLYDQPANLFVAGFIGSPQMNFYKVKIVQEGGKLSTSLNGDKIQIPDSKAAALAPYVGKEVMMGLRPEHILREGSGKPGTEVHSKVEFFEMMGAYIYLYASAGESQITAKMPPTEEYVAGQKVTVQLDMDMAHFFDCDTEKAICH